MNEEKFLRFYGNYIKESRETMALSQEECAKRVNLSIDEFTKIEQGLKPPEFEASIGLAIVLNLDHDKVLNEYNNCLDD